MFEVRFLQEAVKSLAGLDKSIAQRIAERIRWLVENLENIRPERLSGTLAGFFKLRVGDYRIIYEILREERVIIIHWVEHRSRVYRRK